MNRLSGSGWACSPVLTSGMGKSKQDALAYPLPHSRSWRTFGSCQRCARGLGGAPDEDCLCWETPWVRWPAQASVQLQFETSRLFFQSKYEQVQKKLGEVEKQLEEAQQKIHLNDLERNHTGGGEQIGTLGMTCWWPKLAFCFIHSSMRPSMRPFMRPFMHPFMRPFMHTKHLPCSRHCLRG